MSYRALSFRLDSRAVKRMRKERCGGGRGDTQEGVQQHPFLRTTSIIKCCIVFLEDNNNINNNNEGIYVAVRFVLFSFFFPPFCPLTLFSFFSLFYMKLSYRVLLIFINTSLSFIHALINALNSANGFP